MKPGGIFVHIAAIISLVSCSPGLDDGHIIVQEVTLEEVRKEDEKMEPPPPPPPPIHPDGRFKQTMANGKDGMTDKSGKVLLKPIYDRPI